MMHKWHHTVREGGCTVLMCDVVQGGWERKVLSCHTWGKVRSSTVQNGQYCGRLKRNVLENNFS